MAQLEPSMGARIAPAAHLGSLTIARTVATALQAQADAARRYAETLEAQAAAIDAAIGGAVTADPARLSPPAALPAPARAPGRPSTASLMTLVERIVCEFFEVTPELLRSKKRTRAMTVARTALFAVMYEITGASTTQIALKYGGRDHSCVLYARDKVREQEANPKDRELVYSVQTVRQRCADAIASIATTTPAATGFSTAA